MILASRVLREFLVWMDYLEKMDLQEFQAPKASREILASKVNEVYQESQD